MLVACVGILEKEGGTNFFRLRLFFECKLHAQTLSSIYRPFRRGPFGNLLETLTDMKYTMGALIFTYSPEVKVRNFSTSNLEQHFGFLNISLKYFL